MAMDSILEQRQRPMGISSRSCMGCKMEHTVERILERIPGWRMERRLVRIPGLRMAGRLLGMVVERRLELERTLGFLVELELELERILELERELGLVDMVAQRSRLVGILGQGPEPGLGPGPELGLALELGMALGRVE